MRIISTKSYENSVKKLKRHKSELELLDEILSFIKKQPDFISLSSDPLNKMYNFERLKYENNEFYSFRLSKIIRLLVKPKDNYIELYLIYVSMDHYKDFNKGKVIYYDE